MEKRLLLALLMMVLIQHESLAENGTQSNNNNNSKDKVLSRRKRYLVFPTGSSFSVAVCMTIGVYGNPQFSLFRYKFQSSV